MSKMGSHKFIYKKMGSTGDPIQNKFIFGNYNSRPLSYNLFLKNR